MALSVHDTTAWPYDAFDWPNITVALQRLVDRFPDDVTLESLLLDIARGRQTMFVVRDGGVTVSVVLVEIEPNPATGHMRATIRDMGGERGIEAVPLISEIEEWARQRGAAEIDVVGLRPWQRILAPYGYELVAVILRKRL